MNITDKLEIVIVTYNRANFLNNTLKQLKADNSPVKNCLITVLDNASEDNTQEIVQQFNNINYIRNSKNIGMGANISKALEIPTHKYVWFCGDDDNYDFSNWQNVENLMQKEIDCIVVADFCVVENSKLSLVQQLGFLNAGIYKTKYITKEVIQNAYANILNVFPHAALFLHILNEGGIFEKIDKPIVLWGTDNPDPDGKAYTRGGDHNKDLYVRLKRVFLTPGWFNCLEMVKNPQIRSEFVNNSHKLNKLTENLTFYQFIYKELWHNKINFNNDFQNIYDLYRQLNKSNKYTFICALIKIYLLKTISHKIQKLIDLIRQKDYKKELFIDYVEMTISTLCTLKCKDCWHLIPRYCNKTSNTKKLKNYSLKELEKGIDKFLASVDKIGHFAILGGEPLLNNECHLIMQKLLQSSKIEEVQIISNGTMDIPQELLNVLKDNPKACFIISDYGELSTKKDKNIEILKQNNIKTIIRPCAEGGWYNTGNPEENCHRSKAELKEIYTNCTARCCYLLLNNKLYVCPRTAHSIELGLYKPKGNEYVDLCKFSIRKTRKLIQNVKRLTYIHGCNYCLGNLGTIIPAARQIKNN